MNHLRELAETIAAQCWCDDRTVGTTMDPVLAEVFTDKLCAWISTAAQNERNTDFYRGLLDKIAEHLGPEAYMADDGVVHDTPLRFGLPDLVSKLCLGMKGKM